MKFHHDLQDLCYIACPCGIATLPGIHFTSQTQGNGSQRGGNPWISEFDFGMEILLGFAVRISRDQARIKQPWLNDRKLWKELNCSTGTDTSAEICVEACHSLSVFEGWVEVTLRWNKLPRKTFSSPNSSTKTCGSPMAFVKRLVLQSGSIRRISHTYQPPAKLLQRSGIQRWLYRSIEQRHPEDSCTGTSCSHQLFAMKFLPTLENPKGF